MSSNGSVKSGARRPWVWGAVLVLAAVVVVGAGLWGSVWGRLAGGDDPELDAKLNSLNVNLEISHFDKVLGKPAIAADKVIKVASVQIKRHAKPKRVIEEIPYREYFYIHDSFYVQAIADDKGKVGLYSITVRDTDYLPNLVTPVGGSVRLGKNVYSDLQQTPSKIAGLLEPDRQDSFYYEIYHAPESRFAIFSSNTNGYLKNVGKLDEKTSGLFVSPFAPDGEGFPIHDIHGEYRKVTTINTYTLVAGWVKGIDFTSTGANYGSALINFGPRADQLNVVR